jgi:hypothetical protein
MAAPPPLDPKISSPSLPNMLDLSGTTLPLISTVLAGFSLTIIVTAASVLSSLSYKNAVTSGLVVLTVNVPILLFSTTAAIRSQAFSYRYLMSQDVLDVIGITKADLRARIPGWHTRWYRWYLAGVLSYYLGLVLFALGMDIIVWAIINRWAGILFIAAFAAGAVVTVLLVRSET